MLTLPEAILLFALHDEKGTVRSSAYIAIEGAVRGAAIGELLLRGAVRIRRDGAIRSAPASIDSPLLQRVQHALSEADDPGVLAKWMFTLKYNLPDLRELVTASLVKKGALIRSVDDRTGLEDTQILPTANQSFEQEMIKQVRLGVACGSSVPRRMGILIGLIHVCELWGAIGDARLTAQGRGMGEWVLARDSLCQAVRVAVHKAEGTFEL